MKTYPIMLNVRDRLCVVVGAGEVGLRKARSLARCGARVRLVAEQVPDGIDTGDMEIVKARYETSHLDGAMLVMACADDEAVNERVAADARSAGALVNVADGPQHCDFFAAATAAEGDVVLAVGTGGSCPALAAALAETLAGHLPRGVGEFAEALGQLRTHVHRSIDDPARRKRVLAELAGPEGYEAFVNRGMKALRAMAEAAIKAN